MHAIASSYIIINFMCPAWNVDKSDLSEEHNYEITETMRLEMEYDADQAWYLNLVWKLFFIDNVLNS